MFDSQVLVEYGGANVNVVAFDSGYTPLHYASLKGSVEAVRVVVSTISILFSDVPVQMLLAHGGSKSKRIKAKDGKVPLDYICLWNPSCSKQIRNTLTNMLKP